MIQILRSMLDIARNDARALHAGIGFAMYQFDVRSPMSGLTSCHAENTPST